MANRLWGSSSARPTPRARAVLGELLKGSTTLNILILTDSLPGCTNSTAPMVASMAAELQRCGHNVTIVGIGSEPHVATWPHSVHQGTLKSAHLPIRATSEATASIRLFFKVRRAVRRGALPRPNLCIVFLPSIFLALTNRLLRLLYRCATYVVQRDILPDWMVESGKLKDGFAARVLRAVKHLSLDHAEVVGVECEENFRFIPPKYGRKLRALPNWRSYHTEPAFHNPPPDSFAMIYGGRIGIVQGFDTFLAACLQARDVPGSLDIYCDERGLGDLEGPLREYSIRGATIGINVHPMLAEPDFIRHASRYSLGIVTLSSAMKTHNIPGKLLGYLAAGIPVFAIGPKDAVLRRVISTLQVGVYEDAADPARIAAGLRSLAQDRAHLRTLRNNVIARRHTFDVRDVCEHLLADVAAAAPSAK